MGRDELDHVQALFERGDVLVAASAIRQIRLRAQESGDSARLGALDDMVGQMRAYLTGYDLRQFDDCLAGSAGGRAIGPPAGRVPPATTVSLGRVSFSMIAGWACCLLIVVGAIGPWAKTVFGQSASGIDGRNDGWIMLVASIAAGILVASFIHDPDRKARIFRSVVTLGIGIALAAIGIYDWHNTSDALSRTNGLASVGWGLELDTIAALGLAFVGLIMLGGQPRGVAGSSGQS